jgi:hypothetical protein
MDLHVEVKTLVLGIGGGYDIYTALPWFLSLSSEEQSLCLLANYSFTHDLDVIKVEPTTLRTEKNENYFPEHHLAVSLNRPIYTFRLVFSPHLEEVLKSFIEQHGIQQIYMFDGGIDSVIFGDEYPYGSPTEDSQSVLACFRSNLRCRLFVSAIDIDECDPEAYLRHWVDFPNKKYQLGPELSGWQRYSEIVSSSSPSSIIQESIVAAGEGHRGKHKNPRLFPGRINNEEALPSLSDQTCTLWEWDLRSLVDNSPFYQYLLKVRIKTEEPWDEWDGLIVEYLRKTPLEVDNI